MFVIIKGKDSHFTPQFKISRPLYVIDCVYDLTIAVSIFLQDYLSDSSFFFMFNGYLGKVRVFKFIVLSVLCLKTGAECLKQAAGESKDLCGLTKPA